MSNIVKKIKSDKQTCLEKIKNTLSGYEERTVKDNGEIISNWIETDYFLVNDKWDISWLENINNFDHCKSFDRHKNLPYIDFSYADNKGFKLEIKYITYMMIFTEQWSLYTAYSKRADFKRIIKFINKYYSNENSFLKLNITKAKRKWIHWFQTHTNLKLMYNKESKETGEVKSYLSAHAKFFDNICNKKLMNWLDDRAEWKKDQWDIRNLEKDYNIAHNNTNSHFKVNFSKIINENFKEILKKYLKQRLINRATAWSTARSFVGRLVLFFNFLHGKYPSWETFKDLSREDILGYYDRLNKYIKNYEGRREIKPDSYMYHVISKIETFLSDLQRYEYEGRPIKAIERLIYPEDKPKVKKKSLEERVKEIPDTVLEQLFNHFDDLHEEVQPVVLLLLKTGLRVSDALSLKQDCLIKEDGEYYIQSDIKKTKNENHVIPIDNELADMVAVLIHQSKQKSNNYNNPNNYIFCRYKGNRRGLPYPQHWIYQELNILAREKNITDEKGEIFHFSNHMFRHTYAMKMLNEGEGDLFTVSQLMAHSSPKMTMTYARKKDNKKREVYEKAYKNGAFYFNKDKELVEDEEIDGELLDAMWVNAKLKAVDTPYGACVQTKSGNCDLATEPPCLTRNGGEPCSNLLVTSRDVPKYEMQIQSKKEWIKKGEEHNRDDWIEKNKKVLNLCKKIYNKIKDGNIICGRKEHLSS